MSGSLTFEMDDPDGFVRVRGTGFWTPEQAAFHFIALRHAVEGLRAIRRPVFVLVDLAAAALQPDRVMEAVSDGTASIYGDADFVAMVVGTRLLGLQMRRAHRAPNFAIFQAVEPAAAWLQMRRAELRV